MAKDDFLCIGKIVGVHGIRGNIKVSSYAESLTAFTPDTHILIRDKWGSEKKYTINWAKPHQRVTLLSLKDVDDRNTAEALINATIFISKSSLPELSDGIYYWFDIIGLNVFTTDETYLGRIDSIFSTGSNDVYVIKKHETGQETEILIPALKTVVKEINLMENIMRVELPDGLE